jgi:hypothetical protein
VSAGDVLGDSWGQYTEDVLDKISIHVRLCDVLGTQRALWYTALSGILYASAWFPNPWWTRAVGRLHRAFDGNRVDEVYNNPPPMANVALPDETFWATLAQNPATLTGPQCLWTQGTRIRDHIAAVRETDRQQYGPPPDAERFKAMPIF